MRRPILVLSVAGALAWIANAAIVWTAGIPLGHDEAAYAIGAKQLLAGDLPRWNYRPFGTDLLALPGIALGASERALRIVPLVLGCLFVLAAWRLARRLAGDAAAGWLVAVLAASAPIARRSADLLSDLPAAACLLLAITIVVEELAGDTGPRWRLVAAAPWFAAAFYVRYGSALAIAVVLAAAASVGWRAIVRRPGPAVAMLAVFVALLVPHALLAVAISGSPLGILRESSDMIASYFGSGLATYLGSPLSCFGLASTPLLIGGIASIARAPDRRFVMLWVIAVGDLVVLGISTLAQPRYVVIAIVLLAMLGIAHVERWLATRPARSRMQIATAAAIGCAASWAIVAVGLVRLAAPERMAGSLVAARAIQRDAAGAPCAVIARHSTQLEWYSGCRSVRDPDGTQLYVVIEDTAGDQPVLPDRVTTILSEPGLVRVVRVDRTPRASTVMGIASENLR